MEQFRATASPAYCDLIYRTSHREMLREKEVDLTIMNHAFNATKSAWNTLKKELRDAIKGKRRKR